MQIFKLFSFLLCVSYIICCAASSSIVCIRYIFFEFYSCFSTHFFPFKKYLFYHQRWRVPPSRMRNGLAAHCMQTTRLCLCALIAEDGGGGVLLCLCQIAPQFCRAPFHLPTVESPRLRQICLPGPTPKRGES